MWIQSNSISRRTSFFIPEKRQFFLENAGVFNFPLGGDSGDLLFFSRQIGIDPITGEQVPINGGGKVTGSLGNFELGVMDVDTRSSGPNPCANYAVMRVKRSLWGGSYIGVMGIDKRSGNPSDSFNQSERRRHAPGLLQESGGERLCRADPTRRDRVRADER